ncbi:osteocalcin-like [Hemicordylus capensis]|uniref:osteocalcin-like n=1 Tax=Hemicordylus capensis TaxID=884348 RepID=UPI0023042F2A|nr:osteocalcin-like [Hemicordylus capensis]XP_053107720.1 osteocalcin-like [Hemicordylus capensis]
MGNLLMLLLITLVLTGPCCCEGDTHKLLDKGVKINRETANTFVRRQKRSYPYYERYYEMLKTPLEMKHEQCENYAPCDYYSEHVGFHTAYRYYFGSV